jgi:urease accessory protein
MRAPSLLALLQLSDSAFPTGSFSHSMGLEAFVAAGELGSAGDLERVVSLHLGSLATSDCVALRASFGAGFEEIVRADRLLSATKLARELRAASSATGKRLLLTIAALGVEGAALGAFTKAVRDGVTPGNLAVGYGVAAPALGFGVEEALYAYLYAAVAALVAAGQKLIPLGGSVAQRALYESGGEVIRAAEASEGIGVEEMRAFAPLVDVYSMRHERQRVRLYIS